MHRHGVGSCKSQIQPTINVCYNGLGADSVFSLNGHTSSRVIICILFDTDDHPRSQVHGLPCYGLRGSSRRHGWVELKVEAKGMGVAKGMDGCG